MLAFLVTASVSDQDGIVERLWEMGTAGIEERTAAGDRLGLVTYFNDDRVTAEALRRALSGIPEISVEATPLPDVDWVARFRENFQSFAVGGFTIVPEWEKATVSTNDPRVLIVDPGRAFGTGTHESTALCLAALERLSTAGALGDVADIGTGSGILAIAALKLGARTAVASDLDPEALLSARQHAGLNDTALPLIHADGGRPFASARFDTVLANIMAPVLIERASEAVALLRPGGRLVLAGLLASELGEVRSAYQGLGALREETRGEWASLVVERGGRP